MEDPMKYPYYDGDLNVKCPKQIAEITLCGALHIVITDSEDFIRPTEEQIKNLHDMLCIDVKLFDE